MISPLSIFCQFVVLRAGKFFRVWYHTTPSADASCLCAVDSVSVMAPDSSHYSSEQGVYCLPLVQLSFRFGTAAHSAWTNSMELICWSTIHQAESMVFQACKPANNLLVLIFELTRSSPENRKGKLLWILLLVVLWYPQSEAEVWEIVRLNFLETRMISVSVCTPEYPSNILWLLCACTRTCSSIFAPHRLMDADTRWYLCLNFCQTFTWYLISLIFCEYLPVIKDSVPLKSRVIEEV